MFVIHSWLFYVGVSLVFLCVVRIVHNYVMMKKWQAGEVPDLEEFGGVYRVWMLPRWLFFWFLNVKRIEAKGSLARPGYNTAYRVIRWGEFQAAESVGSGLTFVYDRLIRDYVRRIAPGRYLGQFYLVRGKRKIFVFWFLLIREGVGAYLGAWGSKQDDRHGRA